MYKYVFVLFLLSFNVSWSKIIDVGNKSTYISNINRAINVSNEGDTIIIHKGLYNVNDIIIGKRLTLIGKNGAILDGNNKSGILLIHTDSVIVKNLTFRNVRTSYTNDYAAIKIINSSYCEIRNNKIFNSFFGIYCKHTSSCKILDNYVRGNAKNEFSSGNAIHLWYCDKMLIENNDVAKHRDGIYFEFVKNSKITNNKSYQNIRYGLHFMFSDSNKYYRNVFKSNGAGVAVMYSSQIDMRDNDFIFNIGSSSYGLLLKEIYDSEISNNRFTKNTIGVYAESVSRCNIHINKFERNGFAIKIFGSSTNNNFNYNNFFSNTFDISSDINTNKNNFSKNYWDKYYGYDLNHDGIGDVPYFPVKLFAYISAKSKESLVLLHSLFIKLLDLAETMFPILTPTDLNDSQPLMRPYNA